MKTVKLEVKQFDDVLKEVENACKTDNATETTISFDSATSLWKIISPAKQEILHALAGSGVRGCPEISKRRTCSHARIFEELSDIFAVY